MRTGGSATLLAIAAIMAVTAGCSAATSSSGAGSSSATSTTSASSGPGAAGATAAASPGLDTPEDAVDGIIHAELAGNWSLSCFYWAPAQQSLCKSNKPTSAPPTGNATVDGAVISGNLALVKVTGKICTAGNGCQSNTNPSAGLPTGSETFKQAYDKQLGTNSAFSPVPCIEINGKWYLNTTGQ